MTSQDFKAIIIGGSVAGLTLAHAFRAASVPFILLEARDTISPQLGASLVIMPNGARILDQLGLYEKMKNSFMCGMKKDYIIRGDDGKLVFINEWSKLVEERLGYQCGICERWKLIESIYEQLDAESKGKVLLNKKVIEIVHFDGGAMVKCADGSEYRGDIVVGADGIHSRARREMQRYGEETGPPGLMDRDKNSITAEYNCFLGATAPMPELNPGDSHISVGTHHSSLLFVGKEGVGQWFFYSKMAGIFPKTEIPRYTKQQIEAQAEEFANFHITETITLKEIMSKTTRLSSLPLEEGHHKLWTYGRIVCLGDSIHKMTPNLGQGGNQAIESAAVLANCLQDLLSKTPTHPPRLNSLQQALQKYQNLRQNRAKVFVNLSGLVTRSNALATLRHTLRFLYFEPLDSKTMADFQTEMFHTAPYLDFLPLPAHTLDNAIWKKGLERVKANDTVPKPRNVAVRKLRPR